MKIIVIGAGIAGLSIGWRLRQSGADVTVLERAQPGRGATWASAGMIAATAEIEEGETAQGQFARRSASLWPQFARGIEDASGIDVGYRADGTMMVASSEAEEDQLRQRAETSLALQFLDSESARALEPLLSSTARGALLNETEAQVDNRALAVALQIAFQRAGGVLQANESAIRIEVENGRAVAARSPFHLYPADAFVLAAGAWSSRIEGLPKEAVPPIVPVKGEMIALAPNHGRLPQHMIWGEGIYMVPRHDRLLAGATVTQEGFDTRTTQAAAEWLHSRAMALMPPLASWDIVEHWAGLRPGSPDDLPLIGPSGVDRLFIASGQFRNGILFAPALAHAVADLVLGKATYAEISAFDPRRFANGR